MKAHTTLASFAMGALLLLPGCEGNPLDWADETFYQSKMTCDHVETVKPFIKGVRLYDQLETLAFFDALWLSDQVRTAYAQVYSKRIGKDEEAYTDFLRRELSANTYFISFYVLSFNTIPLTDVPPLWSMHLDLDGKKYQPVEIKAVELGPEFTTFFGRKLTQHKRPFEVRFNRKDADDKDILDGKKRMKLFFCSPRYYDGTLVWNLEELNKVVVPALDLRDPAVVEKQKQDAEDAQKETRKTEYQPRQGRFKASAKKESPKQKEDVQKHEHKADEVENLEFKEEEEMLAPQNEVVLAEQANAPELEMIANNIQESEGDSIEGLDGALLGTGFVDGGA